MLRGRGSERLRPEADRTHVGIPIAISITRRGQIAFGWTGLELKGPYWRDFGTRILYPLARYYLLGLAHASRLLDV